MGVLPHILHYTNRVLPTLVGFGNYQPPLTTTEANLPVLTKQYKFHEILINFGDTGAIFTTSQILWGEPCTNLVHQDGSGHMT